MPNPSPADALWIPWSELQRAGLVAALPPDVTAVTVQPLGAGIAAVKASSGALVCVILSPAAWQRIQALDARWRRLFGWAAERALAQHPGRGGACRQS